MDVTGDGIDKISKAKLLSIRNISQPQRQNQAAPQPTTQAAEKTYGIDLEGTQHLQTLQLHTMHLFSNI